MMQHKKFECHIDISTQSHSHLPLELLSAETKLSRQCLKQTMHKGAVWLTRNQHTQRLRRVKKTLQQGDVLHLYYDEKVLNAEVDAPTLVADEGAYSVWDKPYGMLSQGSRWGDHCTLSRWVETQHQPQRPVFTVHRLDRAASGLMLIAHRKKTASALATLFQQRKVEKHYQVRVQGEFPVSRQTVDQALDKRKAVSHFQRVDYKAESEQSLLDVIIETGRKHQIRRHLAYLGYPVVGDRFYGIADQQHETNLQLRACYLSFMCPISHTPKTFNLGE